MKKNIICSKGGIALKDDVILETLEEILDDSELTKKLMELKDISSVYKFLHSLNSSVTPENLEKWMETNMINNTNFNLNKLSSEDLECVAGGVNNTAAKATLLSAMMVLGNSGFLSNNTSNAAYQTNDSHYREVQKNKSKIEILKEFVLPTLPVMIPAGIAIGATGAYLIHQKYKKNNTNENRPDNPSNITSKNKNDRKVNNAVDAPFVGLQNSGNTCFANAYLQLLDSIHGSFAGDVESILDGNGGSDDLARRLNASINFIDEKLNAAKYSIKADNDFRGIYNILTTFQGQWNLAWYTLLLGCSFSANTKNNILNNFFYLNKPLDCTWTGFAQNFKTIFLDNENYYDSLKDHGCSQENVDLIKIHARNLEPKLNRLCILHELGENLKNQRESLANDVINNNNWHERAQQLLNIFSRMHQNQKSGSIDVSDFTRNLQREACTQEDPTEAFNNYLNLQTMLPYFIQGISEETANNWCDSLPKHSSLLGKGFLVSLNKNLTKDPNAKDVAPNLPEEITSEDGEKYRLKGIVCHQGDTIYGGHYIAYRWDENSSPWWKCNDSSVTQEHGNILEDSTVRKTAYVLAYEKVNN